MKLTRLLLVGAVLMLGVRTVFARYYDAQDAQEAGAPATPGQGIAVGEPPPSPGFAVGEPDPTWGSTYLAQDLNIQLWQEWEDVQQSPVTVGMMDASRNVQALREAIAWCEGTANQADPYRVCFGYKHTIQDFGNHPALSGEWAGEPLDFLGGKYVGLKSTAAGKYQINAPTFKDFKSRAGVSGFSPAEQDALCNAILRSTGAYAAIERGDLAEAVRLARTRWASLPGAGAGQGERSLAYVQGKYTAAGGALA